MIKTVVLTGEELMVKNLGGFNTVVHNLGDDAIYASKCPNITTGADNVAEIPAGSAKLISTTNGTVYLLGFGKAELTGQDHDSVNFKQPSSLVGGGTSDVTRAYVDKTVSEKLDAAKEYADTVLSSIKDDIPTTLPANGGNADTVNGHTVNADVPEDAKFTDTTYSSATPSSDGLESREDKSKLDGIEAGAQVNTVTGVKGGAESDYRTGSVSLTAANVGAAKSVHGHSAADITSGVLPISRGGTGNATGRVTAGAAAGVTLGAYATAEGIQNVASASYAHAEGRYCAATVGGAHAQGYAALAKGANSAAFGGGTVAWNPNQLVIGMHNKIVAAGSPFVIGWGEPSASGNNVPSDSVPTDGESYSDYVREGNTPKNIFRVALTGAVYGVGAFNTSGADYAEYIKPWFDGNANNEDRRGYFVTIKNGKLHKAEPEDYIVGITSGNPSVIGNGDEDWLGRWQRDEFNELVYKDVEIDDYEEREDENGDIVSVKVSSHIEKHTVQNSDYDPEQEYIERKDRPEWSCVGMIGVLPLRDDGTCIAGGFAKCGAGGIATAAAEWDCHKTFFVIERINDHVISVEMR